MFEVVETSGVSSAAGYLVDTTGATILDATRTAGDAERLLTIWQERAKLAKLGDFPPGWPQSWDPDVCEFEMRHIDTPCMAAYAVRAESEEQERRQAEFEERNR